MRLKSISVLLGIIFLVAMFGLATADETAKAVETAKAKYEYIGAKKCKMCHKKDGIHESWAGSKHATAWDSLSPEDQKKEELNKYYTTGTTAKGDLLTGIQCESCHGPGSAYKKKAIMQDPEKSAANGLIMPTAETCKGCHNEKAPAAVAALAKDFDFEKMKAKGTHQKAVKVEAKKK